MPDLVNEHGDASKPISDAELLRWQRRSNARGLVRLALHLAAILAAFALYAAWVERGAALPLRLLAGTGFGFTLVTMFAAMHECVHRTAFASRWLNDGVGWCAGLLSFYNSTFYRPYHAAHHRFTQLKGQDPELEDRKPTGFASYLFELSGAPWWLGKFRTYASIALGRTLAYDFLNEQTAVSVVRSVRLQLLVYAAAIGVSVARGRPDFVTYFLVPVALGQPLLRAILLAEHTGCSDDGDPLENTRSTHTFFPVRLLMWEMPYHAEHHRYPALPFFALASAHARLGPHLRHVARFGYLGFHVALLRALRGKPAPGAP
jgi:fatty acid desaturase